MPHSISDACVGCGACKRVCPVDAITGLQKECHIIDPSICIDCGACGIVCPVSCISDEKKNFYQFLKPKERPKAEVNYEMCSGCQYCVSICPFDCLDMEPIPDEGISSLRSFLAQPNKCVACQLCIEVCPREAIALEYPISGGKEIA